MSENEIYQHHANALKERSEYRTQADILSMTLSEVRRLARALGKNGMDFLANTNLGDRVDAVLANYNDIRERLK